MTDADSNRLSVRTDICGFFKDNEYFSPTAVGQTYPGTAVTAVVGYQAADRFLAEAGVYGVVFSGGRGVSGLQPFVRLQYSITPKFKMVLGNLYGGINHRLIEPLYRWERHWTARPESGLQFVLNGERVFADVWVDWMRYIERGDNFTEMLTFGSSLELRLNAPESRFHLSIPVQLLIGHHGGQIDVSDEKMIVLGNIAGGLRSRLRTGSRWLRAVGLELWWAGYHDKLPDEEMRPFSGGSGIYPVLRLDATPFTLMAGYWAGNKFYAPLGEMLFASFDPFNPGNRESQIEHRELLTLKIVFEKTVLDGLNIGAHAETYSDIARGETDYSFGVFMRFNHRWLLGKKIKNAR